MMLDVYVHRVDFGICSQAKLQASIAQQQMAYDVGVPINSSSVQYMLAVMVCLLDDSLASLVGKQQQFDS